MNGRTEIDDLRRSMLMKFMLRFTQTVNSKVVNGKVLKQRSRVLMRT